MARVRLIAGRVFAELEVIMSHCFSFEQTTDLYLAVPLEDGFSSTLCSVLLQGMDFVKG
jgi:hypothetical protein